MPLKTILEAAIWLGVLAVAILAPAAMEPVWAKFEEAFRRFARRRILSCAAMALAVLAGRAALLVVWDIPQPVITDEFGYLLQADTFASGRMTNPTHAMAEFFETPYVLQKPTYNAKFPPGQGLALALGQATFGHPWFGVWLSCGALAAALCWALQGWFEPEWALMGTILALPFCTLTYCMNSYWGGAVAATGGALVFGALARTRENKVYAGAVFALGATILMLTRPFEGAVVLIPATFALLLQKRSLRHWIPLLATAAAGMLFLGQYNASVTGNALRLPYVEYESQYPMTSHFTFLAPPSQGSFARAGITVVDHWERAAWQHSREPGFYFQRLLELVRRAATFLGSAWVLLPVIALAGRWRKDGEYGAVCWAVGLTIAVAFVELVFFIHYAAPVMAALLILTVAGYRRLREWTLPGGRPAGRWLTRAIPVAALAIATLEPAAKLARGASMDHPGAGGRALLEQLLDFEGGQQVIFVRHKYPSSLEPRWQDYPSMEVAPSVVEFVQNGADIDGQRIVWAHDLGDEANRRLRTYYKDRKYWLYDPAENPGGLTRIREEP